jgi:hypothetical protein
MTMDSRDSNVDKAHRARGKLVSQIEWLRRVARSANTLGLDVLSDRLHRIADGLEAGVQELFQAWRTEFDARLKDVQENSVNVLKATLAGMDIGTDPPGQGERG